MKRTSSSQSSQRLKAHYAVSRLLAGAPRLREAAPKILEVICRITGWQVGGIWSVDALRGEVYSVVRWQSPEVPLQEFESVSQQAHFRRGEELPGRVWASGEPEWIADVTQDGNFVRAPQAAQAGLHAAVAFPIRLAEQVLGVMEFFSRKIREPDPELLRMMETIGHQIGQYIVRRRAEAELRESEARYRRLAEAMPQIAWTALPSGEIDYFNERWYEFTGLPPGQVGVKTWKEVLHPEDHRRCMNLWRKAVKSGCVFQMERRFREARTGNYQWFLSRAVPVRDAQGNIIRWYGTSTNIDDQKKAEENHARINETLYSILETIPDIVFVTRRDGHIDFRNPAARRFAQALGIEDELPEPIRRKLAQVLETGEHHLPSGFKTVHRFELNRDDRYFLSRIAAMRTPDERIFGAVVLLQDVTEFRLLDEVKTNLISTVSHELKTPITSLRTALLLLLEQRIGTLNSSQLEMLHIAQDETERLLRMLNTLLDLTRFENDTVGLHPETTTVEELVRAAVEEVNAQAEVAEVRIVVEPASNLPPVKVDRERILHVLTNLLTNAIKYSPRASDIRVQAKLDGPQHLRVSVIDHGPGVPPEFHSRIFDKFFRVPGSPKRGAGLGLSIAREFVRAHRGVMNLKSAPGQGSEFYFILPLD